MDAKGNHLSTYDVLLGDSYIYLLLNQDILLQVLMTKASLLNHLRFVRTLSVGEWYW